MMDYERYNDRYDSRRAHVRVFHASPDAPPVDVYLNDYLIAKNLTYKTITPYLPLCPGRYNVRIFPTGTMNKPVIDQMVEVRPQDVLTLAAVGRVAEISLLSIAPSAAPLIYGKAFIRFVHLSPNAPRVDVAVQRGPILFRNVGYQEITNYQAVEPGTYNLEISLAGTGQVVLEVSGLALDANRFYTAFAVGLVGQQPPLEAILALDMEW